MATRVLIVDDSGFFRRRIAGILQADPGIDVIGMAANGQEAIDQVKRLNPDVVTMDIEMPVMDGITAVRHIMSSRPVPVLMFSSLSHEGAQATLDALAAGAVDFLPKRFEDIARDREEAGLLLRQRIHAVGRRKPAIRQASSAAARVMNRTASACGGQYQVVVIASSTGGPVALQQVLTTLPSSFPRPVLVVQHMPASFTPAFANRLDQQCAVSVREAQDGDLLKPGQVLIAPGGKQMLLQQRGGEVSVRIEEGNAGLNYKPCADITFASTASVYGGNTLAMVLTGMGSDGCKGAQLLKQDGATIWSQDEASSVIYGMPMAIAEAGLSDEVLPLGDIGPSLVNAVAG